MKLNLGCGSKKLEGWINVDSVAGVEPDLLHDISLPFQYADYSIDEILAEGILEHFDKYLRFIIFYEWVRMLKMGGIITIGVPNFHKILCRYFKFNFDTFLDNIFGETMLESEVYIGHFGIHKWGYTENTLKEFVKKFGMKPIKIDKKGLSLTLSARKCEHIKKEKIDNMEIYSSANDNGLGKGSIFVKQVRQKVKGFFG